MSLVARRHGINPNQLDAERHAEDEPEHKRLGAVGGGASIVNLASLAGRKGGHPGSLVYSTAKGAMLTFTRALANELGPRGVRVNALA